MVFTSLVSFNLNSVVKCCLETLNTVKSDNTIQNLINIFTLTQLLVNRTSA